MSCELMASRENPPYNQPFSQNLMKTMKTVDKKIMLLAFLLLCGHSPVPRSMKRTLEIGRKLVPLSRSSSPPSTEQEVRLTDSMTGSSWAERWAEAGRKQSGSKLQPELKQLVY